MKQKPIEESYNLGYASFRVIELVGKYWHVPVNPMKVNSIMYKEWERGRNDAYANNLKRIQKREQARARS